MFLAKPFVQRSLASMLIGGLVGGLVGVVAYEESRPGPSPASQALKSFPDRHGARGDDGNGLSFIINITRPSALRAG